jgi:uncharacterized RDD family membrane protein YckC
MTQQAILLIIIILGSVPASISGVGYTAEVVDNIYMIKITCSPYAIGSFFILLSTYIYAARQPSPSPSSIGSAPSLIRRFIAFGIDIIVNGVIVITPFALIALFLNSLSTGQFQWVVERPFQKPSDNIYNYIFFCSTIFIVLLLGYSVSRQKQSVGGLVTRTYIQPLKDISLFKAFLRAILGFFTLACGALSIPWAWLSEDKRMWHDSAFGTCPKIIDKSS